MLAARLTMQAMATETQSNAREGTRGSIQQLPPLVVNQIAAGEVVERPASVVKELVENSIDAGATRIRVELEQGGVELIRIADNGCGIPHEELRLALTAHATSKLRTPDELDRIGTMGFRGEALASVASVSRMRLSSRTEDVEGASQIDVEGDDVSDVMPASGPVGTTITVRNLFFNTPARRRFLRTTGTEQGHCVEAVRSLAMSHPAIGFEVVCDGVTKLDVAPGQAPRDRAMSILGEELAPKLIEVSADEFDDTRGVAIWGVVGLPELARPTAKAQKIFINGRLIQDRSLQHALREAYRGLIDPSRKPTAVIMIEMDPAAVDVNVHPAKAEVRFRDPGIVYSTLLRAVRSALQAQDLTPSVRPTVSGHSGEFGSGRSGSAHQASGFVEALRTQPVVAPRIDFMQPAHPPQAARASDERPADSRSITAGPSTDHELAAPRPADRYIQIHNSYLVTQDESGVVIIDQHALHERVMFEQIMSRLQKGDLESQRLLTPATLSAAAREIDRLEELRPLLERLGIEVSQLGPESIGVQAFPSFLFSRGVEAGEFVSQLLERVGERGLGATEEEALHEVVDMMSCKAAVKAGDRLTETELAELVRLRAEVERSSNCPHGRPTTVRLSIQDLERFFGRS